MTNDQSSDRAEKRAYDTYVEAGFREIDTSRMLFHPDGRVAAAMNDGRHCVHGSVNDAEAWLRQETAPDDYPSIP